MIVVAALSPSLDLTYTVPTLAYGAITRTPALVTVAGGKALNLARAASTIGAPCSVVVLLGGPTGRYLQDLLSDEGLDVTAVDAGVETRTCVSIADETTGRLTEVYQDAAAVDAMTVRAFLAAVQLTVAGQTGWLAISGRAPQGAAGASRSLIDLARAGGLRVAVDTHSAALTEAVAHRPDLVKINRAEAAALLGTAEDDDPLSMAARIHQRTAGLVVITDGTAGAVAHDGRRTIRVHGPSVVGRYAVGSGDSFFAGLLTALHSGDDLAAGLRRAAACGAANAITPGQGVFSRATVDRLADDVEVSEA